MAIRKPVVSGQFYPADPAELLSEIKKSFTGSYGPGDLPEKRSGKKLIGVIAPHAGYMFSGQGAAQVYKEIGEAEFPDTYIIIGVNHSGSLTCTSSDDWKTPLGIVKCDRKLATKLVEKGIPVDNEAHQHEHSIEVQLPFLQSVSEDRKDDLRIVPIMMADDRFEHWGRLIKEAIEELDRKVVMICSSDFTHYGPNYGFSPGDGDAKKEIYRIDEDALLFITKPDPKRFLDYTDNTGATICGKHGISTLLWLVKYSGDEKKGELLKYYTSGDIVGDYTNAVGYGAVVFR